MLPHRVALRGRHRWPELLEWVLCLMPWALALAAASEQVDDGADQTQPLTDGQEHPLSIIPLPVESSPSDPYP